MNTVYIEGILVYSGVFALQRRCCINRRLRLGIHRAMSQSTQSKPRYCTTNWKQYNAALKARGSLSIWLDKSMSWFAAARSSRTPLSSFADSQEPVWTGLGADHGLCAVVVDPIRLGLAHSGRYVAGNAVRVCKWHIVSVRVD